MKLFEKLDLSKKRKVFTVGDIHGHFDLLEQELEKLGFNKETDFLVSVGDLVDRGPHSDRCVDWIGKPYFKHVIGNHEELADTHAKGDPYWHVQNGGTWMSQMGPDDKEYYAQCLMDAPYVLEILTPGNKRVGFMHADHGGYNWDILSDDAELSMAMQSPSLTGDNPIVWSRWTLRETIRNAEYDPTCEGIDHVFFGHTPIKQPITRGNCSWIDTGAFATGILTVVEVDEWIDTKGSSLAD